MKRLGNVREQKEPGLSRQDIRRKERDFDENSSMDLNQRHDN